MLGKVIHVTKPGPHAQPNLKQVRNCSRFIEVVTDAELENALKV